MAFLAELGKLNWSICTARNNLVIYLVLTIDSCDEYYGREEKMYPNKVKLQKSLQKCNRVKRHYHCHSFTLEVRQSVHSAPNASNKRMVEQ